MGTRRRNRVLSEEAEWWRNTVEDVHRIETERAAGPRDEQLVERPSEEGDAIEDHEAFSARLGRLLIYLRLRGARILAAALLLLIFFFALAFLSDWGTDGSVSSNSNTETTADATQQLPASEAAAATLNPQPDSDPAAAGTPAPATPEEAPGPPTHEELAAQDPIPLIQGPWRVFLTSEEAAPMYDFLFFDDGTFHESGADHNAGTYTEDAQTVILSLTRVDTGVASDGVNERVEEISWTETFTMTRTGNTMTGSWERESWVFSYNNGFVSKGMTEPGPEVFVRPQRPDDPG